MKHQKIIHILTIVLFVLPLALGLVLFAALPDNDFSAEENRSLQTFPKLTWASLKDGDFGADMNEYFADQFPVRDALVGIKGIAELAIGKQGNNGVALGKDGVLAVRWFDSYVDRLTRVYDTDYYSEDSVAAQTNALGQLAADLAAQNIPLTVIIPPRTLDVYGDKLGYPAEMAERLWADIDAGLDENVNYLDLRAIMQNATENGEYVYYRTDHHWTTKGAYLAYTELMRTWGREADIIPESAFEIETVGNFYGTTWSRAGLKFIAPDTLELWHFEGEDGYTVTDPDTGESFAGFYNREYLAKKDKYSVFLDGTHSVLTVTKNDGTDRLTLLVLKDSFFNSTVPFLAQHYDLIVVNLSVGGVKPLSEYIAQYGCDGVLIMYNGENIMENDALASVIYQKQIKQEDMQ